MTILFSGTKAELSFTLIAARHRCGINQNSSVKNDQTRNHMTPRANTGQEVI